MKKQKIRVGFDLDGVLLYNPARIIRPIISQIKKRKIVIKRNHLQFYCPKTNWEKFLWRLFHKSSIFQASGLDEVKKMVDQGLIEAYVITGRFGYLENDFRSWLKKINAETIFKDCFINDKNEQPHLFKKRKIEELKLDVFVEDNWDIVNYLYKKRQTKALWIYNLFDSRIDYPHKYSSLSKAVAEIRVMTQAMNNLNKSKKKSRNK